MASRGAERHADGEVGFVGVLFSVCFHFGAVRDGVERHDLLQLENTAGKQGGLMLVAASEQFNFVGCAVEAVVDVAGNPLVVIDEVWLVHARCSEGERSVVEYSVDLRVLAAHREFKAGDKVENLASLEVGLVRADVARA